MATTKAVLPFDGSGPYIDAEFRTIDLDQPVGVPDQYNWIKWRTKDGTVYRIHQMTDSHLVNATKYYRRTEMDQILMLCDWYDPETAKLYYLTVKWVLESECKKRGLALVLDPIVKGEFV